MQSDSLDKIVTRYFATVTKETFVWAGKEYRPKLLKVSPLLLRDYTCPPGCGGCCFKFSLDYLPSEARPAGAKPRKVEFNGRMVTVYTDGQEANEGSRCQHLEAQTGRCGIYQVRPFTCDFELIRTLQNEEIDRANVLTQKLFGRGWSYPRVDGGKGALCEMKPITDASTKEVLRKLKRLQDWARHFHLRTWTAELMSDIQAGKLSRQIVYNPDEPKGLGL